MRIVFILWGVLSVVSIGDASWCTNDTAEWGSSIKFCVPTGEVRSYTLPLSQLKNWGTVPWHSPSGYYDFYLTDLGQHLSDYSAYQEYV